MVGVQVMLCTIHTGGRWLRGSPVGSASPVDRCLHLLALSWLLNDRRAVVSILVVNLLTRKPG